MTITTTAPTITAAGISAPSYGDVLAFLQAQYRSIYGADIYLEADSQDGQFLAVLAVAINDANAAAIAIYNSFSPSTGQGSALSSNVKINGIAREVPTYSTVDLLITGQAFATITNGVAVDANKARWSLPASVTIPSGGSITVTATCQTVGEVAAPSGTVTGIATPTLGWQSVTNASASVAGAPVESDASLRFRQSISTAIPSLTVMDGIVGAVAGVSGVTRYAAIENDTGSTDANGIPAHSISMIVEGGDSMAVATAIAAKKPPGTPTYGTTSETVIDTYGNVIPINFYRPTEVPIGSAITVKALPGYNSDIGAQIVAAVAAYINALLIGDDVILTRLYLPANLSGSANSLTFEITSLAIAATPTTPTSAGVVIAFNEVASCAISDIVLTVTCWPTSVTTRSSSPRSKRTSRSSWRWWQLSPATSSRRKTSSKACRTPSIWIWPRAHSWTCWACGSASLGGSRFPSPTSTSRGIRPVSAGTRAYGCRMAMPPRPSQYWTTIPTVSCCGPRLGRTTGMDPPSTPRRS
jgi:uncharacterized phage protein gp47/JayE